MPPRPGSVSPALGKTSSPLVPGTAFTVSSGDFPSKHSTGNMMHHHQQIYDFSGGMMMGKYNPSQPTLQTVDVTTGSSGGQIVGPIYYQPPMISVNCSTGFNRPPLCVPPTSSPYILTPPLVGTSPQYPSVQLSPPSRQQVNGTMVPVSCLSSKGTDWTASEQRPQYYIATNGHTQYVIMCEPPALSNQIVMNPVPAITSPGSSMKAIAPAPTTQTQQPEMLLGDVHYVVQQTRAMPAPYTTPSFSYMPAVSVPYPVAPCEVSSFAPRQYISQPTCFSLINAQANPLMNSANMDVVWHGNFDECFRSFYPHQWQLGPCENVLDDREFCRFNDSAKVRFLCQSCCNAWTSMKGRVVFWFKLDVERQTGSVFFKLFGQKCQKCLPEQFEHAMWYPEEVIKVVMNLHQKVGQTCYGFQPTATLRGDRRPGKPRTQHNSHLCQACAGGICREGANAAGNHGENMSLVKARPAPQSA